MRRSRLVALALGVALALALAGAALAANGGFTPPDGRSPNADRTNHAYYLILGLTAGVFVLVEGALLAFIVKYRRGRRARDAEGPQIRGQTRLEVIWTVTPVLILAAIAAFTFYKLPGIEDTPVAKAEAGRIDVTVEAHRFYWLFRYENGVAAFDRLRAPVGEVVALRLVAPRDDVIHSWWVPALGGKRDVIPGNENRTWFQADRVGIYRGRCAEFCGVQHAAMLTTVEVLPKREFDAWLASEAREQASGRGRLGAETWLAACAKCHGVAGEGLVGPRIVGSALFSDPKALEALLREGRGQMPPVAQTWNERQIEALATYVQRRFASGSAANGG